MYRTPYVGLMENPVFHINCIVDYGSRKPSLDKVTSHTDLDHAKRSVFATLRATCIPYPSRPRC